MRRAPIALAVLAAVGLGACGASEREAGPAASGAPSTYFGWVLGNKQITAVAIHVEGSKLVAYVCDGLGPPKGKAIWFAGTPSSTRLTSADGGAKLNIAKKTGRIVLGSFKPRKGEATQFVAYPAIDGAGIYEVSVGDDHHVTGTSLDGDE